MDDSQRIDALQHQLDVMTGTQSALTVAIALLLANHRGNAAATAAFEATVEKTKAAMLGSMASERKLAAFDEVAASLTGLLKS